MTALFITFIFSTLMTTQPVPPAPTEPLSRSPVKTPKAWPNSTISSSLSVISGGYEAQFSATHHLAPFPVSLGLYYSTISMKYEEAEYSERKHTLHHNQLTFRVAWQGSQWRAGVGFHSYLTTSIPRTDCYENAEESSGESPFLSYCPTSPQSDPRNFHFPSIFVSFGNEGSSMLSLEVTSELTFALFVQYDFGRFLPYFKFDQLFNQPFDKINDVRERLYHAEIGIKVRTGNIETSNWMLHVGLFVKDGRAAASCRSDRRRDLQEMESFGAGITIGVHYGY